MVSKAYNKKIVVAGNVVQIYEYEKAQNNLSPRNPFYTTGIASHDVNETYVEGMEKATYLESQLIDTVFGFKSDEDKLSDIKRKIIRNNKRTMLELQEEEDIEKLLRIKKYRKQNAIRKRNKVVRLINCNPHLTTFLTLTFADNLQDITVANNLFDIFKKRINYYLSKQGKKFEYVAVIEFQKRGAIHYHLLCNLKCPFVPIKNQRKKTDIQKQFENWFYLMFWNFGFVNVQPLTPNPTMFSKDVDNLGAYLVKYMTKELENSLLEGEKNYFTSRGLDKPIELTLLEYEHTIKAYTKKFISTTGDTDYISKLYNLINILPTFTSAYISKYTGKVVFKEYNLTRLGIIDNI